MYFSRTTSVTSESGDERETKSPVPSSATSDSRDYGKARKSIFRKKIIKNKVRNWKN